MNKTQQDKQVFLAMADERRALLCRQALERSGSVRVVGVEADVPLAALAPERYALLILDAALGRSGAEQAALHRLCAAKSPVVWLLRGEDEDGASDAFSAGAAVVLPCRASEHWIAAQACALMSQGGEDDGRAAPLTVGGLKIEIASRRVSLDGAPISLTTAEFDLLYLLARNPGCALSRDRIYQELRGILHNGLDRSLDLRIARLRKKLGDDGHAPRRILSIRGLGYQLAGDP